MLPFLEYKNRNNWGSKTKESTGKNLSALLTNPKRQERQFMTRSNLWASLHQVTTNIRLFQVDIPMTLEWYPRKNPYKYQRRIWNSLDNLSGDREDEVTEVKHALLKFQKLVLDKHGCAHL